MVSIAHETARTANMMKSSQAYGNSSKAGVISLDKEMEVSGIAGLCLLHQLRKLMLHF